jgi:hypothetical protein
MDWVIQFSLIALTTAVSLLSLHFSKPENKVLARVCTLFIFLTIFPSAVDKILTINEKYAAQQSTTEIQRHIYNRLALYTHRFLGEIERMMLTLPISEFVLCSCSFLVHPL